MSGANPQTKPSADAPEPGRQFLTRLILCLVISVPVSLCALLALFTIWRTSVARESNRRLQAIKAAGLPTSGAQLNDYYPAVPKDENAAVIMEQAFAQLRTYPDERSNMVERFSFPLRGQTLTTNELDLVQGYVQLNSNALETARVACLRPRSRYNVDLTSASAKDLSHLGQLRTLALVAKWRAALLADSGRGADAARDVLLILCLAHTLDWEPERGTQMMRNALVQIAATCCEQVLDRTSFNAETVLNLERAFGGAVGTNSLRLALVGERADYIPWFRLSFLQPTGFAERVGPPVIRSIGIFERDLQFYLDVFDTNLVLARVGPPETLKLCAINTNLIGLARTNRFRLSSMLLQGLPRLPQKDAVAYAYSRFAQTALAIERFRSTYGRVPEHLSELVPEFLPSVLIDPFDGQPLRFHALPKGYVIYSIDADGQDNGGKEHPHHIQNMVTNSVRFRNVVAYPGVPATNNQPFGPLPASSTFTNSPTAEFREVPTSTNPPPYDLTFIVER